MLVREVIISEETECMYVPVSTYMCVCVYV